ncbi:MAG: MATE family efflux transporter, partial [Pseudomonadota bacterium]|nr:MATE family efflux transporter [Pseudomonadota bacterium]
MPLFVDFKRESAALWRLSIPIILSQIAQVLVGLLDAVMAGHAGAHELAVVGLGVALWIPAFVTLMNVVQAVSPVIAQHVGAGDHAAVARDAREGVMLSIWIGLLPLLLTPGAPALLR